MTSLHADEAFLGHYQLSHDPLQRGYLASNSFLPSASLYWVSFIIWRVTASCCWQ